MTIPPFHPRFPWLSGDLQTVRNTLVRPRPDLSAWSRQTVWFTMADGDRLSADLHAVEWAGQRPLVILIHGLTGSAESYSNRNSAATLLAAGYPILNLNLRGAPANARYCTGIYHSGRSEDLREILDLLPEAWGRAGLFLIGYSLGANMLLKFLGEQGADTRLLGAMAVCAPFDLSLTAQRFLLRRNRFYHNRLLAQMKRHAAALCDPPSPALLAQIDTTWAFDDLFVAPRNGFAGAEDYYARCSAKGFVHAIQVPTVLIHPHDDPWIPIAPYLAVDWAQIPAVTPVFPAAGGHVGFHDRAGDVWYDRVACQRLANFSAMSMAA